jgi:hypothetical protein
MGAFNRERIMRLSEIYMTIEDVELEVKFYYYPGIEPVTNDIPERCQAEEYPEVDIDSVIISGTTIDIYSLLSQQVLEKIETKILETADADYD